MNRVAGVAYIDGLLSGVQLAACFTDNWRLWLVLLVASVAWHLVVAMPEKRAWEKREKAFLESINTAMCILVGELNRLRGSELNRPRGRE